MPKTPRRPMSNTTRSRLGGHMLVATHGPGYMATNGHKGATALDRRIAAAAGIPDDLPEAEYAGRLAAARSAYYVRLAEARWAKRAAKTAAKIAAEGLAEAADTAAKITAEV